MKGILDKYVFVLILLSFLRWEKCDAGTYEDQSKILDTILNSTTYRTQLRPVNNQSDTLYVVSSFELVSIVGIDDVGEKFQCNGFLVLLWNDERLTWNPEEYGNETTIRLNVKDIWKPRVLLLNTLSARDLFEDYNAPLSVESNGNVMWAPGSVFTVSCDLDMLNYPFDIQKCELLMISNGYSAENMLIIGTNKPVGQQFFTTNGEWDLVASNVTENTYTVGRKNLGGVKISFTLQRRPTFLMLNVIIPVVLLSFLNILVFLIPVDSGEKISYGITVLLAVAVFLSIVSSMLPRSSKIVPNVTVYLASLLIMSVLTVVDSIIIVFLHNLEENEDASIKASENFQQAFNKVKTLNNSVGPMSTATRFAAMSQQMKATPGPRFIDMGTRGIGTRRTTSTSDSGSLPSYDDGEDDESKFQSYAWKNKTSSSQKSSRKNKYRLVGKYIDLVSFFVFLLIWLALTLGFMISISTLSQKQ